MRIIETDNFGNDYPDEKFINLPSLSKESTERIASAINAEFPKDHRRYYRVVENNYILQPGFEP